LRVYPELRHEIFNEPEREKVFADVLKWVRGREAEAHGTAA
jgi:alpha-beta hydrolase superfamily lysophospholipase